MSDKDYPEYEGITDFINCMFDYAKVIEPIDSDSAAHELVVQNVLLANDQTDALEAADKRIAELESKLYRKDERIKAWQRSSDEFEAELEALKEQLAMKIVTDEKG